MGHISNIFKNLLNPSNLLEEPRRNSSEKKRTIHKSLEFKTNKEVRSNNTLERKGSKAFLVMMFSLCY